MCKFCFPGKWFMYRKSSAMLRPVDWYIVTGVSKGRSGFFRFMYSEKSDRPWNMKAPRSLAMSVTVYQSTRCNNAEYLDLEQHHCQNLKSLNLSCICFSDLFLLSVPLSSSILSPVFDSHPTYPSVLLYFFCLSFTLQSLHKTRRQGGIKRNISHNSKHLPRRQTSEK